jgi:hypothetical protein
MLGRRWETDVWVCDNRKVRIEVSGCLHKKVSAQWWTGYAETWNCVVPTMRGSQKGNMEQGCKFASIRAMLGTKVQVEAQ